MIDLDDLLRRTAGELADELATAPVPAFETPRARRQAARWIAAAAAALLVVIAGAVAVNTSAKERITSVDAPATDPTTTPSPSTLATAPVPTEPSVSTTGPQPMTFPLSEIAPDGGPVAVATPPDGYRPVLAGEGPAAGALPDTSSYGRISVLLGFDDTGTFTRERISIGVQEIYPWDDGPYGHIGQPIGDDVTIGEFTGRWLDSGDGSSTFVASIDDTSRLVVSGHASQPIVESVIVGLDVPGGNGPLDVPVPDGFRLVDPTVAVQNGDKRWYVTYANADLSVQFQIETILNPTGPLETALANNGTEEQATIAGNQAIVTEGGIIIDVRPDVRVRLTGVVTSPTDGLDFAAYGLDLRAIAEDLVGFSGPGWQQLVAEADAIAATLPTMPPPCPNNSIDARIDPADSASMVDAMPAGAFPAGQPLHVTVAPIEGTRLERVTARVGNGPAPYSTEIASVDTIDAAQTLTLMWNGTIDGTPQGAGTYNLTIEADVVDTTGQCGPQHIDMPVTAFYVS